MFTKVKENGSIKIYHGDEGVQRKEKHTVQFNCYIVGWDHMTATV